MSGEILVEKVSKRFTKRQNRADSIKSLFVGFLFKGMRETYSDFWALKDVTVSIAPGESLGLIGPNGAGKSTLLYLVAGTMPPTKGTIEVKGSVAPMIELGLGFHPELTGRENIYLNASLYGLTRHEIESIYPDILVFSELMDFIDSPMFSYSNGMKARLAFSIAINLDMDILLVDEVLSVGDSKFQEKCIREMLEFRNKRKTILFVSHDMNKIELICDRACFLNKGEVLIEDSPQKAIAEYEALARLK